MIMPTPPVALLRMGPGNDGRLLPALAELGYPGAVIEAFGGDHVPPATVPLVERLVGQMPVVLASRAGAGAVLTQTYRLPAAKSSSWTSASSGPARSTASGVRLLLTLCLAAAIALRGIAAALARVARTTGPVTVRPSRHAGDGALVTGPRQMPIDGGSCGAVCGIRAPSGIVPSRPA